MISRLSHNHNYLSEREDFDSMFTYRCTGKCVEEDSCDCKSDTSEELLADIQGQDNIESLERLVNGKLKIEICSENIHHTWEKVWGVHQKLTRSHMFHMTSQIKIWQSIADWQILQERLVIAYHRFTQEINWLKKPSSWLNQNLKGRSHLSIMTSTEVKEKIKVYQEMRKAGTLTAEREIQMNNYIKIWSSIYIKEFCGFAAMYDNNKEGERFASKRFLKIDQPKNNRSNRFPDASAALEEFNREFPSNRRWINRFTSNIDETLLDEFEGGIMPDITAKEFPKPTPNPTNPRLVAHFHEQPRAVITSQVIITHRNRPELVENLDLIETSTAAVSKFTETNFKTLVEIAYANAWEKYETLMDGMEQSVLPKIMDIYNSLQTPKRQRMEEITNLLDSRLGNLSIKQKLDRMLVMFNGHYKLLSEYAWSLEHLAQELHNAAHLPQNNIIKEFEHAGNEAEELLGKREIVREFIHSDSKIEQLSGGRTKFIINNGKIHLIAGEVKEINTTQTPKSIEPQIMFKEQCTNLDAEVIRRIRTMCIQIVRNMSNGTFVFDLFQHHDGTLLPKYKNNHRQLLLDLMSFYMPHYNLNNYFCKDLSYSDAWGVPQQYINQGTFRVMMLHTTCKNSEAGDDEELELIDNQSETSMLNIRSNYVPNLLVTEDYSEMLGKRSVEPYLMSEKELEVLEQEYILSEIDILEAAEKQQNEARIQKLIENTSLRTSMELLTKDKLEYTDINANTYPYNAMDECIMKLDVLTRNPESNSFGFHIMIGLDAMNTLITQSIHEDAYWVLKHAYFASNTLTEHKHDKYILLAEEAIKIILNLRYPPSEENKQQSKIIPAGSEVYWSIEGLHLLESNSKKVHMHIAIITPKSMNSKIFSERNRALLKFPGLSDATIVAIRTPGIFSYIAKEGFVTAISFSARRDDLEDRLQERYIIASNFEGKQYKTWMLSDKYDKIIEKIKELQFQKTCSFCVKKCDIGAMVHWFNTIGYDYKNISGALSISPFPDKQKAAELALTVWIKQNEIQYIHNKISSQYILKLEQLIAILRLGELKAHEIHAFLAVLMDIFAYLLTHSGLIKIRDYITSVLKHRAQYRRKFLIISGDAKVGKSYTISKLCNSIGFDCQNRYGNEGRMENNITTPIRLYDEVSFFNITPNRATAEKDILLNFESAHTSERVMYGTSSMNEMLFLFYCKSGAPDKIYSREIFDEAMKLKKIFKTTTNMYYSWCEQIEDRFFFINFNDFNLGVVKNVFSNSEHDEEIFKLLHKHYAIRRNNLTDEEIANTEFTLGEAMQKTYHPNILWLNPSDEVILEKNAMGIKVLPLIEKLFYAWIWESARENLTHN